MGGGDLNLKKSWHPNTMKNQERVWKAEQADAAEKHKLAELQREISDERDREELKRVGQMSGVLSAPDANKKLEWMYKSSGDLLNREEYLLGRSIDKNFERADAAEKETLVGVQVHKNHVEHECIPFSIRSYHGIQLSDEQVDLQRKIMEDPLMAIKQREMETRKKLLENPVKLKEIHRLLRNDSDLDGKSRKGKDKKSSKKNKKDKKSKKSSKGEPDDLDEILAKKYRKIRKETLDDQDDGNLDIDKFLALKYNQLSNELDKMGGKTSKSKVGKKPLKEDYERSERVANDQRFRDRPQYSDRDRSATYRDRGFVDSKTERQPRNYVERRHERSPDRARRDQKYSPVNKNRRSRSRSTSRRNGDSCNRQREERSDRERNRGNRRSASQERDRRNRRSQSQDRDRRNKQSPSDDRNKRNRQEQLHRDRGNRRSLSGDRRRGNRRSISNDVDKRRRQSPSKDRDRRNRSRSRSNNFQRPKYQPSNAKRISRSISRNDEESTKKIEKSVRVESTTRARSSSSNSSSSSSSDSSIHEEQQKKNYGLVSADGKKIEIKNKYQRNENADLDKSTTKKVNPVKPKRVTLTEEEKEQKLREMQENAKQRVIECQQTVERNKKEKLAEEAQLSETFDKDYINKEMRKAIANQFSVESRIKSNINNIQRSGRTMEANFAKRRKKNKNSVS